MDAVTQNRYLCGVLIEKRNAKKTKKVIWV